MPCIYNKIHAQYLYILVFRLGVFTMANQRPLAHRDTGPGPAVAGARGGGSEPVKQGASLAWRGQAPCCRGQSRRPAPSTPGTGTRAAQALRPTLLLGGPVHPSQEPGVSTTQALALLLSQDLGRVLGARSRDCCAQGWPQGMGRVVLMPALCTGFAPIQPQVQGGTSGCFRAIKDARIPAHGALPTRTLSCVVAGNSWKPSQARDLCSRGAAPTSKAPGMCR